MVQACLLLFYSLYTFSSSDQPMLYKAFLHPTSFHDKLPRQTPIPVCPHLMCFSSQCSLDRLQPHSFFQLLTIVPCAPSLPTDHPGLFQPHLLYVLRADHSHVHRHLFLKSKLCHCVLFMPRPSKKTLYSQSTRPSFCPWIVWLFISL